MKLRNVLLAALVVAPHAARAQAPAPKPDDVVTTEDDDDDKDKGDAKSDDADEDADEKAAGDDGDTDSEHPDDSDAKDAATAADAHASGDGDGDGDEDEGQGEDADEHKHHGHVHHEPGLGLEWVASHARLRLGLAVQPLARYGHVSIPSPDTMDTQVRRARVTFDAELVHGAGLRVDLQAKNEKLGIADLYGRWALDEHIEIQGGFLGAPGGLERDTNPFDLPFSERSSLASLTHDREIGLKLVGHQQGQFWMMSVTRDAPFGIGGDDPDIAPTYPPGTNPIVINRSVTKWNQAARIGVAPSDEFEASLGWTFRFRESAPDYGDPAYEPNGSVLLDAVPYRGTSIRLGADAAVSEQHFRLLVEAAYRRDGDALAYDGTSGLESTLPGHVWWTGGYTTIGWTPQGRYGRAVDGAPLQWGWELLARFEVLEVKPVEAFAATLFATTVGWNWVATPQIRIQADASLQSFGDFDQTRLMDNAGATRFYAELWATWRL